MPGFDPNKVVVLSGAGISAPSGLATFRASGGLWNNYRVEDVASFEGWLRDPKTVLEFYNERRTQAAHAKPNEAHRAIAELERRFEVVVVTQNVDDLHERAGSTHVIHLHGELTKARSTANPSLIYNIGSSPIRLGDRCELGSQLRPHIVWFGEAVQFLDEARSHFFDAGKVLVVGTSLSVYPAAGLVDYAPYDAEKVIVDVECTDCPLGFRALVGSADKVLPALVQSWLSAAS